MRNDDAIDAMQKALESANATLALAKMSLNSALKGLDAETSMQIRQMIAISESQPENSKDMIDSIMDKMQTKLKDLQDASGN